MNGAQVKILNGNTFVVSDECGDIEASMTDPTGLFSFDTRFLSRWVLTVGGDRLSPLSVDDLQYFQTRFFLVPGSIAIVTPGESLQRAENFLSLVGYYPLFPVPRQCVEKFGSPEWTKPENIVCNGPFKPQFRHLRDRTRVKKNELFWDRDNWQSLCKVCHASKSAKE